MAEHMKQHKRAQIEILLKRGFSIPQIARELNRPAMTITLDPILLGERFKRHAEKAILKKNGMGR